MPFTKMFNILLSVPLNGQVLSYVATVVEIYKLKKYLVKHLDPLAPVDEGWTDGTYKIMVSFKVNKDGSIEDIKTDKYQGSKTAELCIDLIAKGPKWEPAIQNGMTVNAYRKQPITFVIEKQQ